MKRARERERELERERERREREGHAALQIFAAPYKNQDILVTKGKGYLQNLKTR